MKAATIEIDLNHEQIVLITIAELVESLHCLGGSKHPDDIKADKKVRKAIKCLLKYYTNDDEYAQLGL